MGMCYQRSTVDLVNDLNQACGMTAVAHLANSTQNHQETAKEIENTNVGGPTAASATPSH